MSLPSQLEGLTEVKGALIVQPDGVLVDASPAAPGATPERAAAAAAAVLALCEAARAAGLGPLVSLHQKGARSSILAAARADALLVVDLDPSRATAAVEKAVKAWTRGEAAAPRPAAPPRAAPAARPSPAAQPAAATPARPTPPPSPAPLPARPVPTSPGMPVVSIAAAAAAAAAEPRPAGAPPPADAWAALRRALGRAHLSEATSLRHELSKALPGRAGAEPVPEEELERAFQALLEGIGSVLAGDGLGGARILKELAAERQPNLSFRWLALYWSARAAVRSGGIPAARAHVQAALTLSRELDVEARAFSQWTAAEVLAHDSDSTRALAWLAESRTRFERAADGWGIGQTWLTEARILAALERAPAAAEAARRAAELLPEADEPHVLLARIALGADDVDGAEELVRPLRSPAAEKFRALVSAIRAGHVSRADASELLREQDSVPGQRALRVLGRIAAAAPRLVCAREALAWMLLRLGKYEEAGELFRGLLGLQLSPADRASVMLGLGCVANAGKAGAPGLRAVVAPAVPAAADPTDTPPPLPKVSASSILPRGAAPGSGAPDSVFSGQLSSFALPDLLEFLRSARRTGLLVCSSPAGMGALRFRDGRITAAASPLAPGLGELLVRARRVTAQALAGVVADGEQPDDVLGERLVQGGLADAPAVEAALEEQARAAVRELVRWRDGEFAFSNEGAPERRGGPAIALDPQAVLLEVLRVLDEESREFPAPAARS